MSDPSDLVPVIFRVAPVGDAPGSRSLGVLCDDWTRSHVACRGVSIVSPVFDGMLVKFAVDFPEVQLEVLETMRVVDLIGD